MGYAIAEVARDRGARVVLVSGPVSLEAPEGVELVSIVSAQDLFDAVSARYAEFDAVVAAAAVADYRPKTVADNKMKKKDGDLSIELERTPDTLSWLGAHRVAGQRFVRLLDGNVQCARKLPRQTHAQKRRYDLREQLA